MSTFKFYITKLEHLNHTIYCRLCFVNFWRVFPVSSREALTFLLLYLSFVFLSFLHFQLLLRISLSLFFLLNLLLHLFLLFQLCCFFLSSFPFIFSFTLCFYLFLFKIRHCCIVRYLFFLDLRLLFIRVLSCFLISVLNDFRASLVLIILNFLCLSVWKSHIKVGWEHFLDIYPSLHVWWNFEIFVFWLLL